MHSANGEESFRAEQGSSESTAEDQLRDALRRNELPADLGLLRALLESEQIDLTADDVFSPGRRLRPAVAGELLPVLLQRTNLRELLDTDELAQAAARSQSVEALPYLFPAELQRTAEILRSEQDTRPDFAAAVIDLQSTHTDKPARRMAFTADPLSESSVSTHWVFAPDGPDGVELLAYAGTDTDILIPPRVGHRPVTKIAAHAFRISPKCSGAQRVARRNIWRVTFPGTIKTIPAGLFADCAATLAAVVLRDGVEKIEDAAFEGCALRSIVLPDSITSLGAGAFRGCTRLADVVLSPQIDTIREETFSGCTALLQVPDLCRVKHVCRRAFSGAGIETVSFSMDGPFMDSAVFAACENLKHVVVQNGVRAIPDGSFADCHALQQVQFVSSLREIGREAFARCRSLQELSLPDGLVKIGAHAFCDCWALASAVLPDSVREVGEGAFEDCAALRQVRLPEGVRLGDRAFSSCRQLSVLQLPEQLEVIPKEAFSQCTSLRSIGIPTGTVRIGERAFAGSGLRSILIPDHVREVAAGGFSGCIALQRARISGSPNLHPAVFRDCINLAQAEMPSVQAVPWEMFRGCRSLRTFQTASCVKSIGTGAFSESGLRRFTVPGSVCEVREGAFAYCADLQEVRFETARAGQSEVAEIASRTFFQCTALRSVVLPRGIRAVGDAAFQEAGIEQIALPDTLCEIHAKAFCDCRDLKEVTFGEPGAEQALPLRIGPYAFQNCTALERFELPARTTFIERSAFEMSGIVSVVLPPGLMKAGRSAFRGSARLRSVRIDAGGADVVSDSIFADCVNLTDIVFRGSVTRIGPQAFRRTGLEEVVIPSSVKEVGNNAFRGCNALRSIRFEGRCRLGTDVLRACHHLTRVELPDGLAEIPARAFRNCTRLCHIAFPRSLAAIGERAFQGTGLTEVCFPASVRTIGDAAFFGCRRLETVSVPPDTRIGCGAFLRCPRLAGDSGTVIVHGTVYGTGRETRFAFMDSRGRLRPPREELLNPDDSGILVLPEGADDLQMDPLLVLPEIVYTEDVLPAYTGDLPQDLCTGDIVSLGRFPSGTDFRLRPIAWIVLDETDEELQLAALQPLFFVRGEHPGARVTRVLCSDFLKAAFTSAERMRLGLDERSIDDLSDTDAAACGLRADPSAYARMIASQFPGDPAGIFVRPVLRVSRRYRGRDWRRQQ